jgi:hypothetical protein
VRIVAWIPSRGCLCCTSTLLSTPHPLRVCCQIDETAKAIEEKLAEVNAERAELVAYQALDKQQRGIEFALLDRELTAARKELAKVRTSKQSVAFCGSRADYFSRFGVWVCWCEGLLAACTACWQSRRYACTSLLSICESTDT